MVKAGGTCLGYQSLVRVLGYKLPVRVWTNSTATIGICGRQGLGKLRHIDTQCLRVQQRVRDGTIELVRVAEMTTLLTKHLQSCERIHSLLALFGCVYTNGRAELAPQLRAGTGTTKGALLALAERPWCGRESPFPQWISKARHFLKPSSANPEFFHTSTPTRRHGTPMQPCTITQVTRIPGVTIR